MSNKYILLFAIVLGSIVVDQWSKQMAVRYLRSPSDRDFRSEHFAPCTNERKKCEKLCDAEAKATKISLVACQRVCKRQETQCRDRLSPSYERAKLAWKKDILPTLKSSNVCRYVKFAGASRPECVVVKNYFHFTYRTNSGAAWGIFSSLEDRIRRPFFICITLIAIMFIFYLFVFRLETEHRLMIIALALILGGALGNFLDRLRLDYVIDFIEWFWRDRASLTWPTFNIADAAISIGVGLIAIELFFFPQEEFEDDEERSSPTAPQAAPVAATAAAVTASDAAVAVGASGSDEAASPGPTAETNAEPTDTPANAPASDVAPAASADAPAAAADAEASAAADSQEGDATAKEDTAPPKSGGDDGNT